MSFSRRVTSSAIPPPPATNTLALSGLSAARAPTGCRRLLCGTMHVCQAHHALQPASPKLERDADTAQYLTTSSRKPGDRKPTVTC